MALNQAIAEAAAGLGASRSDSEGAGAGFPADLAGPFAGVNEYFARVDSALRDRVEAAAAQVAEVGQSYCATEADNAARLAGAADGPR